MNNEIYNVWKQRAEAEVSADFTDRVMDAIYRDSLPPSKGRLAWQHALPAVRVAACILAFLACLCRMVAVVSVFFPL